MEINLNKKAVFSVIFVLVLIPLVFAGFSLGTADESVTEAYGPGANLRGWINISFTDEPSNSLIESSFDGSVNGSITLKELLDANPSYDYSCVPSDCKTNYDSSNAEATKNINMGNGDSELIGLRLNGVIQSVDSARFEIESNAGPSDESQIKIDLMNNGEIDVINNKSSGEVSKVNYGCFDFSKGSEEFNLGSGDVYCQRINLTQSPGFSLGSWVKQVSGSSTLYMSLHNINGAEQETCSLPEVNSSSGQEYSCDINYLVFEPEEHFVCIYTEGTGSYRIKGYSASGQNACGFYGTPVKQETAAYRLFASGKQFDSFGTLTVSDNLPRGFETLSDKIWTYLSERYGLEGKSINCSDGCIVPINLTSFTTQNVTLKNLELTYTTTSGSTTKSEFYDISGSAAIIDSNYQRIFLDNTGLRVPAEIDEYLFRLSLGGKEILSKNMEVKDAPIIESLTPKSTAAGFPTKFTAKVSLPENSSVVNYAWNFGDNGTEETALNEVIHIYPEIGNYTLGVTSTDANGFISSKTFEITVDSPKNLINETLEKMGKNLEKVETYLDSQSSFHRTGIKSVLDLENQSAQIENLKQRFAAATGESDYMDMVGDVLNLNIPKNVFITKTSPSFTFFPESDFVDPEVISVIGGGDYNSRRESSYQNAVISWQQENIDLELTFNEFSGEYGSEIEEIVSTFEFSATEKKDITYDYYLIVPRLKGIEFQGSVEEEGSYFYINLKETPKVSFYTTEDVDFLDIPAFVSPSINRLNLERTPIIAPEGNSRTLIFVLSIVFLVVIAIISYIVLQQWYKKKYEKYLFPNRNDLYNIVNYVNASKKKGLKNPEIRSNLKKAKWDSEQINYVMKKYEGERTGMAELPLTNLIEKVSEKKKENSDKSKKQ